MSHNNKNEQFVSFIKDIQKSSLCQSLKRLPHSFLDKNGFSDMKFLIGEDYEETRKNIYEYVYGPGFCKFCDKKVERLHLGWLRGWFLTCSNECAFKMASDRQMGSNNTSHRIDPSRLGEIRQRASKTMKERIKNGDFTPAFNNYKYQRPIKYWDDGEVKQVRSLWELIYKLNNPSLLYEHIRIEYYDSVRGKNRVYITDFYDPTTNTIIEIRPKAYQYLLADKMKSVLAKGYTYRIVDEDYFSTQKTPEMVERLTNVVCNFSDIKGRLKWLNKA